MAARHAHGVPRKTAHSIALSGANLSVGCVSASVPWFNEWFFAVTRLSVSDIVWLPLSLLFPIFALIPSVLRPPPPPLCHKGHPLSRTWIMPKFSNSNNIHPHCRHYLWLCEIDFFYNRVSFVCSTLAWANPTEMGLSVYSSISTIRTHLINTDTNQYNVFSLFLFISSQANKARSQTGHNQRERVLCE